MNDVKSLVESKTFWAQVLGLVALIAGQFHLSTLNAWAVDPNSIQVILNLVGIASLIGGMVFRVKATAQIVSVLPSNLPPMTGATVTKSLLMASFLAIGLGASGCANTSISGGLSNFFNDVNSIQATMQSPAGKQAIATLKGLYVGTACGIASSSAFIDEIAVDVKATKTVQNTTIVMAISGLLCTQSGGVVAK